MVTRTPGVALGVEAELFNEGIFGEFQSDSQQPEHSSSRRYHNIREPSMYHTSVWETGC